MESVLFEDGPAAVDAAEAGVAGHDPTTLQLAAMRLLAGNLAATAAAGEPFDGGDPYVAASASPVQQGEPSRPARSGESTQSAALDEVARWERLVT